MRLFMGKFIFNFVSTAQSIRAMVLLLFALLLLSSCGAGGGETVSTVVDPTVHATKTIDVVLSKGPVSDARCELFDSTGKLLNTEAMTSRGVGYFGLAVKKGLYYAECQGGQYTDEATGKTVILPSTLKLRGTVEVLEATERPTIVVTPISELAFRAAEAKNDLTRYSAELKQVAKKVGLDPEKDFSQIAPILDMDKVDDSDSGQYAMVLAAVSQLQEDNKQTLPDMLGALEKKIADQPSTETLQEVSTSLKTYVTNQVSSSTSTEAESVSANPVLKRLGEASYKVGGTVTNLEGTLTLQLNGKDEHVLENSNAPFYFSEEIATGLSYLVSVKTQPDDKACEVVNGRGSIDKSDINNIEVNCFDSYHLIGGTVEGLMSGFSERLVLRINGTHDLQIASGDRTFQFQPFEHGKEYSVSISSQPTGQTCTVSNATGIARQAVSSIRVVCTGNPYKVGGTISSDSLSSLRYDGLILTNAKGEDLAIAANSTSFQFNQPFSYGDSIASINVSIKAQPTGQICSIRDQQENGKISNRDYTYLFISCLRHKYSVEGTLVDLSTNGLVLELQATSISGSHGLNMTSGQTNFQFSEKIFYGDSYRVGIRTQPTGQTCSVDSNGEQGTVSQDVNNVTVRCQDILYPVYVSVKGNRQTVVLQNNNGDDLLVDEQTDVNAEIRKRFSQPLTYAGSYDISIKSSPGMNCRFYQERYHGKVSENIGASNTIEAASILCSDIQYTLSATISGLSANGLILSSTPRGGNTEGHSVIDSTATEFTLSSFFIYGETYTVGIQAQPTGQTCTINGGPSVTGTISQNLTIAVECTNNEYTISGSITGLTSDGLTLQNGSERLAISSAQSNFTFLTKVSHGDSYNVVIFAQPSGLLCTFSDSFENNGTATADISISISCQAAYSISANIVGLTSSGLVVEVTDRLSLDGRAETREVSINSANSTQVLAQITSGVYYSVRVKTQPSTQSCIVVNGTGRMETSQVNISIECQMGSLTLRTIRLSPILGLVNDGLLLVLNSKDSLPVYSGETDKNFGMQLTENAAYTIEISNQPEDQTCTVLDPTGTVSTTSPSIVFDVSVDCQNHYAVSGTISGLSAAGLKLKLASQEHTLEPTASDFSFQNVAGGSDYNIVVEQQPTGQHCVVVGANGIVSTANIGDVEVKCNSLPSDYIISRVETAQVLSHTNKGTYPLHLVQNREATVRAFVYAKTTTTDIKPNVNLYTSIDDGESWSNAISMTCSATLPVNDTPSSSTSFTKNDTCYANVPADQVKPKLMLKIQVGMDNPFLNIPLVIASHRLNIKLIPVSITGYTLKTLPTDAQIKEAVQSKMPFSDISVSRRAEYNFDDAGTGRGLLEAITDLRTVENSNDFYYAFFPSAKRTDFRFDGLAWINDCSIARCRRLYVALGTDNDGLISAASGLSLPDITRYVWSMTLRHELGHNLSLWHAPCVPSGVTMTESDPDYPYTNGQLSNAIALYDQFFGTGTLYSPSGITDTMGYCASSAWWFSDYNYYNIQKYMRWVDSSTSSRFLAPVSSSPYSAFRVNGVKGEESTDTSVIMVSGSIRDSGVTLKPIQSAVGLDITPSQGLYTLHLVTTSGRHFEHQFETIKIDHFSTTESVPQFFQLVLEDPGEIREVYVTKDARRLAGGFNTISARAAGFLTRQEGEISPEIQGSARVVEDRVHATTTWDSNNYPYLNLVFVDSLGKRTGFAINATGGELQVSVIDLPVGGHWEISISNGLNRILIKQPR